MTEFTPRVLRTPMRPRKAPCAACKGAHNLWWKTTPPPSCTGRTPEYTQHELRQLLAGLKEAPGGRSEAA